MTRLDKTCISHNSSWIEADKITDLNPKSTSFFFIAYFYIQTHFHIVLRALCSSCILVDMARSLVDEDGS
ncbi:Uncharacterised protein [Streptococcus pneumoniae]|nr:Uncharacterised protein [Streptococcus pneumoniae]